MTIWRAGGRQQSGGSVWWPSHPPRSIGGDDVPPSDPLRGRRLSPASYRRITLLAVWALGFIIVTGGAVRLTGSGLGCPDWPTCARNQVVAPWQYHAVVEFGNRVVTGLVSVGGHRSPCSAPGSAPPAGGT